MLSLVILSVISTTPSLDSEAKSRTAIRAIEPINKDRCWVDHELGVAPTNNTERRFETRAAEIAWRLKCLEWWPVAAQLKLNEQQRVFNTELAGKQRAINALVAIRVDEPAGVSYLTVAIVGGGCLLAGVILGGAAVLLADDDP